MDINAVFDDIFKDYASALEGKSLGNKKPKSALSWSRVAKGRYEATGPRGGIVVVAFNERSKKVTIGRRRA